MATGMVLIIVSRNIDLSVGSLLGFLGYAMALVQTDGIFSFFGVNVHCRRPPGQGLRRGSSPSPFGLAARGARRRCIQGFIVAYVGVPGVHRHPRRVPRLARRRSSASATSRARPWRRSTTTFQLLGGGRRRARSASGELAARAPRLCAASCSASCLARRRAAALRPRACARCGPTSALGVVGCAAVLVGVGAGGQPVHVADHRQAHRASPTRS